MDKYVCIICGYIYDPAEGDPESGIAPGTPFEDIPDDWTCPHAAAARNTSRSTNNTARAKVAVFESPNHHPRKRKPQFFCEDS